MPDIDTTIVFFGTLVYVIAVLVGFFIINELRETNKNFKKLAVLLFHAAFFSVSKESSNTHAKKLRRKAFEILSHQFPEEFDELLAAQSKIPDNGRKKRRHEEFEGLPLNDLM